MRIFIASPLAAPTPEGVGANLALARRLCREVIDAGHSPFAPHLLMPQFLDDAKANERNVGMKAGFDFLRVCGEVWCWSTISNGMAAEIRHAVENADTRDDGIKVRFPWGLDPFDGYCPVCAGWEVAWEAKLYRPQCPLCAAVKVAKADWSLNEPVDEDKEHVTP